jgi:hypothetical protein
VTKQLLNATEVRSSFEQMCRRGVTQAMGAHVGGAGNRADGVVYYPACRARIEPSTPDTQEHRAPGRCGDQRRSPGEQPAPKRALSRLPERDDALFAALAHDPGEAAIVIKIIDVESAQLGHPDAGGIQELKDGMIPQCDRIALLGTGSGRLQR